MRTVSGAFGLGSVCTFVVYAMDISVGLPTQGIGEPLTQRSPLLPPRIRHLARAAAP
jgi:hypothetical protein